MTHDSTIYDLVIIGGGISGMRVAESARKRYPTWKIAVIERGASVGGRIKSIYDDGDFQYEGGPWRINATHVKALTSLSHHRMRLLPIDNEKRIVFDDDRDAKINPLDDGERDGSLTTWDTVAMQNGVVEADRRGYATGYGPAFQQGARGSSTYRVNESAGIEASRFYQVDDGLSEWVRRIYDGLVADDIAFHLQCRVTDLRRRRRPKQPLCRRQSCTVCRSRYEIAASVRLTEVLDSHKKVSEAPFKKVTFHCRFVCVTVPPRCTAAWPSTASAFELIRAQVKSLPLMHVYGKGNQITGRDVADDDATVAAKGTAERRRRLHLIHAGISQQIIAAAPSKTSDRMRRLFPGHREPVAREQWIQVAYTGGEAAAALQRIRLLDLGLLQQTIVKDHLAAGIRMEFLTKQPWVEAKGEALESVLRTCYFPHAVHAWHAAYKLDVNEASRLAVEMPSPVLPGVVMAGESISLKQGWIEGALETADRAVAALVRQVEKKGAFVTGPGRRRSDATRHVAYGNWLIDVSDWLHVHPGSSRAITKFLQKNKNAHINDVKETFTHIPHSLDALRVLASLRCGYKRKNDDWHLF